jgi:hypothetical protein
MYVSRLAFHTLPGRTGEVEQALGHLRDLVEAAGGGRPRILRTHYAEHADFQDWSRQVSALLAQSPKREVYTVL